MAFRRRSTFKRRSAMKMLHQVVSSGVISNAITGGGVIGYQPIVRQLSAKYGRNMPQACTFRVVGLRTSLVLAPDTLTDVGGAIPIQWQWVAPSRHRVAAHEAVMREYVSDVRDDTEWSRGRQLYIGFDGVQTPDAAESVLMRNDAATRVVMLGASAAGLLGMFADYNAKHPKPEGTGALNQPDQDLYPLGAAPDGPAAQAVDTMTIHASKYSAPWEEIESVSEVATGFGIYNGPATVIDASWWAPAGTYLPVMCGLMKIIAADSWWPAVQPGTGSTVVTGDLHPLVRGTITAIHETYIEGWTPLSKK